MDLKAELQTLLPGVECTVSGVPAMLSVPLLHPCQRAEQMLITVINLLRIQIQYPYFIKLGFVTTIFLAD